MSRPFQFHLSPCFEDLSSRVGQIPSGVLKNTRGSFGKYQITTDLVLTESYIFFRKIWNSDQANEISSLSSLLDHNRPFVRHYSVLHTDIRWIHRQPCYEMYRKMKIQDTNL